VWWRKFIYFSSLGKLRVFSKSPIGTLGTSFITVLEILPHRKIITFDVAAYFLEFDWFYEDDKNTRILDYLK
jgi:hypothetical protein